MAWGSLSHAGRRSSWSCIPVILRRHVIFPIRHRGIQQSTTRSPEFLDQEQITKFKQDGYLIVEDVLDRSDIDEMRQKLDECVKRSASMTQSDHHFKLDPDHSAERPILQRVALPSVLFPVFKNVFSNERLVDIVSQLIGPSVRYIHQDKLNLKPPKGAGIPIKFHQDWAFFPYTNQSIVTVCLSIDDSTKENGCLQVIPESHRGPLYSHYGQDNQFVGAITDKRLDASSAVRLEVPAGGVSIHHALAVHGSASNQSDGYRRLFCFNYSAGDAWPLLGVGHTEFLNVGKVDWDTYKSTMVRGEASVYPRMEALPVALPVPFTAGYDIVGQGKAIREAVATSDSDDPM